MLAVGRLCPSDDDDWNDDDGDQGCSEEGVDWVCQGRQSTPMHSLFLLHGGDDDDDYAWTMFSDHEDHCGDEVDTVSRAYHDGGDGGNVERRAAQCK